MSIGDIVAGARGSVDAVFVFHYRDIGSYAIGTGGTGGGSATGFTRLDYEGALFDTATVDRLLALGARGFSVTHALASDPTLQGKVVGSADSSSIVVNLPPDAVVERTLAYLRDGTTYRTKMGEQRVEGLVNLIP